MHWQALSDRSLAGESPSLDGLEPQLCWIESACFMEHDPLLFPGGWLPSFLDRAKKKQADVNGSVCSLQVGRSPKLNKIDMSTLGPKANHGLCSPRCVSWWVHPTSFDENHLETMYITMDDHWILKIVIQYVTSIYIIHIYIHMGCLQNVGSRKRSKFAFCLGPAFWRIHFSHVLFFKKKSRWLNSLSLFLKLFLVWLPVLIFLKLKKTPGKVRNRSETGQKHQKGSTCLASIHPSTSSLTIATSTTTNTSTYFDYYYYYLLPTTYYLLPTTYYLLPTTYYLLPTTYYLLPTTYYLLPTTYYLLPTTYYLLPTTYYLLLTTYYYLLPTTYYLLLPTTYYLLPTTYYYLLPTTYYLLPTTNTNYYYY